MDPLQARASSMFQLARVALAGDNLDAAVSCLGEALKCDPENADYQRVYTEVATRIAARKAAATAAKGGDKMVAAITSQHVALGEAALERGDRDEAHRNFQLAMKLAPDANEALREMSQDRQEHPEEEEIDDKEKARVERAIRRDNAQKYYQRGETARLAEDWDEALKCFEGALALDPAWPKYKEAVENARFEVRKREPLVLPPPEPMTAKERTRIRVGLTIGLVFATLGYVAPQLEWEPPVDLAKRYAVAGPFERLNRARGIGWSGTLEEGFAGLSAGERDARCRSVVDVLPGRSTLLLASSDGYAVACVSEGVGEEALPPAP